MQLLLSHKRAPHWLSGVQFELTPVVVCADSCMILCARASAKPPVRKVFRRFWNRVISIPARLLMRIMSRRQPQQEYDGIQLIVVDFRLVLNAAHFFAQTKDALLRAASGAPGAYSEFRKDVQHVFLWDHDAGHIQ